MDLSRDTSNANLNKLSVRDESVDVETKSQASRETHGTKGSSNRTARKTLINPQVPKLLAAPPLTKEMQSELLMKEFHNIEEQKHNHL